MYRGCLPSSNSLYGLPAFGLSFRSLELLWNVQYRRQGCGWLAVGEKSCESGHGPMACGKKRPRKTETHKDGLFRPFHSGCGPRRAPPDWFYRPTNFFSRGWITRLVWITPPFPEPDTCTSSTQQLEDIIGCCRRYR